MEFSPEKLNESLEKAILAVMPMVTADFRGRSVHSLAVVTHMKVDRVLLRIGVEDREHTEQRRIMDDKRLAGSGHPRLSLDNYRILESHWRSPSYKLEGVWTHLRRIPDGHFKYDQEPDPAVFEAKLVAMTEACITVLSRLRSIGAFNDVPFSQDLVLTYQPYYETERFLEASSRRLNSEVEHARVANVCQEQVSSKRAVTAMIMASLAELSASPLPPEYADPPATRRELLQRINEVARFYDDRCLRKNARRLAKSARHAISLKPAKQGASTCSKLGGVPLVPGGFRWPHSGDGVPYVFVAQFDLKELPRIGFLARRRLPASGLLSVFVAGDGTNSSPLAWEPGFVRVYHFAATDRLESARAPTRQRPAQWGPPEVDAIPLEFQREISVPLEEQWDEWPELSGDAGTGPEVLDIVRGEQFYRDDGLGHLFGYPLETHTSLGVLDAGWEPLLSLPSVTSLGWCWLDAWAIVLFAKSAAIRVGDFSEVRCEPA